MVRGFTALLAQLTIRRAGAGLEQMFAIFLTGKNPLRLSRFQCV